MITIMRKRLRESKNVCEDEMYENHFEGGKKTIHFLIFLKRYIKISQQILRRDCSVVINTLIP